MKKAFLSILLAFTSCSVFSQGAILFQNTSSSLVYTGWYTPEGALNSSMGGRVALYYSTAAVAPPVSYSDLTGWTLSTPTAADAVGTPIVGRFAGGTQFLDSAAPNSSVWLMVRGWTGGFADWSSAYNAALGGGARLGMTEAWQQNAGAIGDAATLQIGPAIVSDVGGLIVGTIPEPSTFALVGLTLASVVLVRRKRS